MNKKFLTNNKSPKMFLLYYITTLGSLFSEHSYKRDMKFSIIIIFTSLVLFVNKIQAQKEEHPFLNDIKEAYKLQNLKYDKKVENLLFRKLPESPNIPIKISDEEKQILKNTMDALFRQFFVKVKTGGSYCSINEIKKQFGQSPEERIGISSGGYYRLFVAYWTFKSKLSAYHESNFSKYRRFNIYYLDELLNMVDTTLAGAFFSNSWAFPNFRNTTSSWNSANVKSICSRYYNKRTL